MKGGSILGLVCVVATVYFVRTHFTGWILSATTAPTCLEMLGSTTSEENGVARIIGSVKNNCDRKYLYVQVAFTLDRSNAENAAVRDLPEMKVSAAVRDLEPGSVAEFHTPLPIAKNSTYRFDGITAY